ncbi:hypothetical protein [Corallococcus terminator]|uniref:hypothetical protein n=1 Tax=Corallococcus terminator TaxID=2316733 RepID=UPI00131508C5|nr:hypothetical protein [Corallococcus terminator]
MIVSPPADDPSVAYAWFLVTPEGTLFRANEVWPGDETDAVDINRASLIPL